MNFKLKDINTDLKKYTILDFFPPTNINRVIFNQNSKSR